MIPVPQLFRNPIVVHICLPISFVLPLVLWTFLRANVVYTLADGTDEFGFATHIHYSCFESTQSHYHAVLYFIDILPSFILAGYSLYTYRRSRYYESMSIKRYYLTRACIIIVFILVRQFWNDFVDISGKLKYPNYSSNFGSSVLLSYALETIVFPILFILYPIVSRAQDEESRLKMRMNVPCSIEVLGPREVAEEVSEISSA